MKRRFAAEDVRAFTNVLTKSYSNLLEAMS
jgi:hypothetical protein